MKNDPAMVAAEKIIEAFPVLRGQMLHGMPTIIRDAYAETLAERDRIAKRLEQFAHDMTEADTHIRESARRVLGECVYGDSTCVPPVEEIVDRLTNQVEELRQEVVCQSCGCNIICGSRNPDDFRCHGCGKVVCQTCVDVFDHLYDREHGSGDPCDRLQELRRDAERYRWLRSSSWEVRRYYPAVLQSASVGNLDEAIDAALKETT